MGLFEWLFGSDKKEEEKKEICQTAPEEWGEPGTKKYYYESYLHNLIMRSKPYFLVDLYNRYGNHIRTEINDHWFYEYFEVYDKRYGIVPQCEAPQDAENLDETEPIKGEEYFESDSEYDILSKRLNDSKRVFYNIDHKIICHAMHWNCISDHISYKTKSALKILDKVFDKQLEEERKDIEWDRKDYFDDQYNY